MNRAPEEVHQFWFADTVDDPAAAKARSEVWFRSTPRFDDECRERFEPTIAAAARGELAHWEREPRSAVALVIVLDQFPRNIYRNTGRAFEYDTAALAVTRRALAAGFPDALSVPERAFLLMPYQHVEDVATQAEGVRLFEGMCAAASTEWRAFCDNSLDFARKHFDIVRRFGRFPHRNAALGRASTQAERDYLDSKPDTFGQGA